MRKNNQKQKLHAERRSVYEFRHKIRRGKTHFFSTVSNSFEAKKVPCPKYFLLQSEHCEGVLSFINDIKKIAARGRSINIDMKGIKEIGEGAISMLLSVLEELKKRNVGIYGTMPEDKEPKEVLLKSGFLKFVRTADSRPNETKNTILKTGDASTHQSILTPEIRQAMHTVWGISGRNPLVYGCVFEMMRNSCDHAFKARKQIRWHWSISHEDKSNLVKFSFVDNGKGLLTTFSDGILKKMIHLFKDSVDLVETTFHDGIESRTGLPWRGKGLPTIYETYTDNYIKNLIVITNDVFIDFDKGIKRKLNIGFEGTYYYWIVDKTCEKACFL